MKRTDLCARPFGELHSTRRSLHGTRLRVTAFLDVRCAARTLHVRRWLSREVHMKKLALALGLAMAMMACRAQVRVQAKAETPKEPPRQAEPAPAPEPKAGEQIVLPDQIEFEFDRARIKQTPKTLETLQKLAELMKSHPKITKLRIEGHTDNVGTNKHNDKLSKQRADAVAKWLAQHEVEDKRLATVGYGARRPVKPNDNETNRAGNRRTEYYVEELDGKKVEEARGNGSDATVASTNATAGKT
jgi:outer membrane protein OmpA-like peptidoglycan-associated protein